VQFPNKEDDMLVLSFHRDGVAVIGEGLEDTVRVRVIEIRGDRVRLGFEAPDGFGVNREAIWASKVQDQVTAQVA
jgi:carbon storage regulator